MQRNCGQLFAITLSLLMLASTGKAQQQHVLSLQELHDSAAKAASARSANYDEVSRFLKNESVQKVMKDHRIDGDQLRSAVAMISDDDLARLAAKARTFSSDVSGGAGQLTDAQVTLFIMGVVFLIAMAILLIAFN